MRDDHGFRRVGKVMGLLGLALLGVAVAASCRAASPPGIIALRWERRVILVSAPAPDDPSLLAQRRALAGWRREAEDRDVTIVWVVGGTVEGVGDPAAALREGYGLPPDRFGVVLIGKDGRVAVRSAEPVGGGELTRRIDAMPMRRAGQR